MVPSEGKFTLGFGIRGITSHLYNLSLCYIDAHPALRMGIHVADDGNALSACDPRIPPFFGSVTLPRKYLPPPPMATAAAAIFKNKLRETCSITHLPLMKPFTRNLQTQTAT